MFEETELVFPCQTFLSNPSKLRIYVCKIPTVITETLIVYQALLNTNSRAFIFPSNLNVLL
jgi:hypothetical protein